MLDLSNPQYVFLKELDTKFRAYVGGFGSGKTYVGCLDLGIFAKKHPKVPQGYFAPTYRDIRDTFFPTVEEALYSLGLSCKIKTSDKEVHMYRGRQYYGVIICRSMDNPGSIVGFKIARALIDEIDTMAIDKATLAWRKIIARLRFVINGVVNGIGVTTTPEGFKFVYNQFALDPTESYSMVQASTYENEAYLPEDYISSLLETYTKELVMAYVSGMFVNLTSGSVYRSYDRERNRSNEKIKPKEVLHWGMDFNVEKMAAKCHVERANGWHQVAEFGNVLDTPTMIDLIKQRYPEHRHIIYPDASGKNRSTKGARESDIGLLRQAGFTVNAKDSNPLVRDRYTSVNAAFEKTRLWINDRACPSSARCLEQQAFDENGEPDKKSGHDHDNDATGYFVYWQMPVVKPVLVTGIGMRPRGLTSRP